MTLELFLTKRRALYKGEVGLFPSFVPAADDMAVLAEGEEVEAKISSPKNIALQRYLWALVDKVAHNSSLFADKDHAMEQLKLRVRYAKMVMNDHGELELRAKSIKRASNEELQRLTNQIIQVVCSEVLPGMKASNLRKEIEEMVK